MSIDNKLYPRFYADPSGELYAFLSKNRMFHLKTGQHGKGSGFEFRIYKTRRTVLKFERSGMGISFDQFKLLLSGTFADYLTEITNMLPKAMLGQSNQKLIS